MPGMSLRGGGVPEDRQGPRRKDNLGSSVKVEGCGGPLSTGPFLEQTPSPSGLGRLALTFREGGSRALEHVAAQAGPQGSTESPQPSHPLVHTDRGHREEVRASLRTRSG